MLNESNWSNNQLQIFCERENATKLFKELLRGYLCIAFGHTYVRMSEHLAHRFNRYALFQGDKRGKGVPCCMENTYQLRIWKNVENKPITCCELVDFLYSASMIGKQFNTEY